MSRLIEYLKLLPEGFKNRDLVFEGLVNKVKEKFKLLPEDQQEEIIRRRVICEACPFNSENAKELTGFKTDRIDKFCIHCNCNLELKTSSLQSKCGIDIWNRNNPEEQMPLKWDIYNKNQ